MTNKIQIYLKNFDWILFFSVFILIILGLIEIYSVTLGQGNSSLIIFKKQIIFIVLGLLILFILAFFDYHNLRTSSNYIYLIGFLLLLGVLIFGETIRGTKGWFNIGGLTMQPVEFVKFILIIFLAKYFSSNSVVINPIKHFIFSGIGTLIFVFLVLRQPDFGSALILFLFWASMLFVSGFKKSYILSILIFIFISFILGWFFFFADYQKDRIVTFLKPEISSLGEGYNMAQATIAIGSGKLLGRGVSLGSQSQLRFLPEAQNDFIFAVIAEELGFIGVVMVFFIFCVFFYRLFIAIKKVNNDFGVYFLIGVAILIFIEMVINISMNLGLLPVIGISLPFLSYGGSAIISTLMLVGVAESIIIRSKFKY